MNNAIETGTEYLSGNTYAPSRSTVLGVVDAAQVPASYLKRMVNVYCDGVVNGQPWVKVRNARSVSPISWVRMDVFAACYYRTHDEMIAAYATKQAPLQLG
jgi:hypothetical protein